MLFVCVFWVISPSVFNNSLFCLSSSRWLVSSQSRFWALKGRPFEPLQSAELKPLSLKTALLLALASVKQVSDLQVISVNASWLEFGPNNSKVILRPRPGYVPKIIGTPFRAQVISLSALPASGSEGDVNLLCPVRALRAYITRSVPFRGSEQLFV